jgi:hypothetical protein
VGKPSFGDGSGHSPNHARRLILRNHCSSGGGDLAGSAQAVLTHAGEYGCHAAGPVGFGGGPEQHVDGWAAGILRWALLHYRFDDECLPAHFEVKIARRDQHLSGLNFFSAGCFGDFHRAVLIQSCGQMPRKYWRHVLNNENADW